MTYYLSKLIITTILIVTISEVAKRSSLMGAVLASIPLISVLAMTWLYIDTKDISKVVDLSTGVFWLVLPSLAFFVVLPILLKLGVNFYLGMLLAGAATVVCYYLTILILGHFGIKL